MALINTGFGNIISADQIIAIVSPDSAPIKRLVAKARDRNEVIDMTYGRKTKAVIITASNHVILSAIQPKTHARRSVLSAVNNLNTDFKRAYLSNDALNVED